MLARSKSIIKSIAVITLILFGASEVSVLYAQQIEINPKTGYPQRLVPIESHQEVELLPEDPQPESHFKMSSSPLSKASRNDSPAVERNYAAGQCEVRLAGGTAHYEACLGSAQINEKRYEIHKTVTTGGISLNIHEGSGASAPQVFSIFASRYLSDPSSVALGEIKIENFSADGKYAAIAHENNKVTLITLGTWESTTFEAASNFSAGSISSVAVDASERVEITIDGVEEVFINKMPTTPGENGHIAHLPTPFSDVLMRESDGGDLVYKVAYQSALIEINELNPVMQEIVNVTAEVNSFGAFLYMHVRDRISHEETYLKMNAHAYAHTGLSEVEKAVWDKAVSNDSRMILGSDFVVVNNTYHTELLISNLQGQIEIHVVPEIGGINNTIEFTKITSDGIYFKVKNSTQSFSNISYYKWNKTLGQIESITEKDWKNLSGYSLPQRWGFSETNPNYAYRLGFDTTHSDTRTTVEMYEVYDLSTENAVATMVGERSYDHQTSSKTIRTIHVPNVNAEGTHAIHSYSESCTRSSSGCRQLYFVNIVDLADGSIKKVGPLGDIGVTQSDPIREIRFSDEQTQVMEVEFVSGKIEHYDLATGGKVVELPEGYELAASNENFAFKLEVSEQKIIELRLLNLKTGEEQVAATGSTRHLTQYPTSISHYDVSADGTTVVYVASDVRSGLSIYHKHIANLDQRPIGPLQIQMQNEYDYINELRFHNGSQDIIQIEFALGKKATYSLRAGLKVKIDNRYDALTGKRTKRYMHYYDSENRLTRSLLTEFRGDGVTRARQIDNRYNAKSGKRIKRYMHYYDVKNRLKRSLLTEFRGDGVTRARQIDNRYNAKTGKRIKRYMHYYDVKNRLKRSLLTEFRGNGLTRLRQVDNRYNVLTGKRTKWYMHYYDAKNRLLRTLRG